jgi:enoyl-CoA hydratase/carnithine racemase
LFFQCLYLQAIGGGAELTLATDFRLFTPNTELRFVQAKMGVGTGWGGGTSLQRLVGHPKALELLLSCRKVTSEEAVRIGLAQDIISNGNTLDEATRWISNLINSHHPSVIHLIKQIVACNSHENEKEIFSKLWGGEIQIKAFSSNIKHN